MITLGLGLLYISIAEHILSPEHRPPRPPRFWPLQWGPRTLRDTGDWSPVTGDQLTKQWLGLGQRRQRNSEEHCSLEFTWLLWMGCLFLGDFGRDTWRYMWHPFDNVQVRFLENITSFKPWIALESASSRRWFRKPSEAHVWPLNSCWGAAGRCWLRLIASGRVDSVDWLGAPRFHLHLFVWHASATTVLTWAQNI